MRALLTLLLLTLHTVALAAPGILPWIEVNSPTSSFYAPPATDRDTCVSGIEHWARVTDRVIVTTRLAHAGTLYPWLVVKLPAGVRCIGGIKPLELPSFDDAAVWAQVADACGTIAIVTGQNLCVIDNETPLAAWTRGEAGIDLDRLRASLQPLRDSGLTYWFNLPRLLGDTAAFPDRRAKSEALVRAMADAVPNSLFLLISGDPLEAEMTSVVGGRVQTRLIVTPDGMSGARRYHTVAEAVQFIRAGTGPVNVYTGGANWTAVAQDFAAQWTAGNQPRVSLEIDLEEAIRRGDRELYVTQGGKVDGIQLQDHTILRCADDVIIQCGRETCAFRGAVEHCVLSGTWRITAVCGDDQE